MSVPADAVYRFSWRNNSKRLTLHNRRCTVVARGKINSVLIEFLDNRQREVVSRYSIRKEPAHG